MPNGKGIVSESSVDEQVAAGNLSPVNTPPALPSNFAALTNPYPSGSLPLNFQYAPDLLNTQSRGGTIPQIRLMPIQGGPANNAQSQSISESISQQVVNNITNSSGELLEISTNNVPNSNQEVLNLAQGAGITLVNDGTGTTTLTVTAGGNYQTVEGEGVAAPQESVLNFQSPIQVVDNPGVATNITVPVFVGS